MSTLKETTKEYIKKNKKICCICGLPFTGFGNNPYPVKEDGRCCDFCNSSVVIPERIKQWTSNKVANK